MNTVKFEIGVAVFNTEVDNTEVGVGLASTFAIDAALGRGRGVYPSIDATIGPKTALDLGSEPGALVPIRNGNVVPSTIILLDPAETTWPDRIVTPLYDSVA